jgi:hypothetical protein
MSSMCLIDRNLNNPILGSFLGNAEDLNMGRELCNTRIM